jgi:hypothetical protein
LLGHHVKEVDAPREEDTTNVLTCYQEKKKYKESAPNRYVHVLFVHTTYGDMFDVHGLINIMCFNSVLIDDNEKLREDWESAGGILILHSSTEDTLKQLR